MGSSMQPRVQVLTAHSRGHQPLAQSKQVRKLFKPLLNGERQILPDQDPINLLFVQVDYVVNR